MNLHPTRGSRSADARAKAAAEKGAKPPASGETSPEIPQSLNPR